MTRGPTPIPADVRFWRYVSPEPNSGCWLWDGAATNARGYEFGVLKVSGRGNVKASRLSWEMHCGPIPVGAIICHHCDTSLCVNPAHLYIGTYRDNARDASARNRWNPGKGEQNPQAKLTAAAVRVIREGGVSDAEAGRLFGVTRGAARKARISQTWRTT